jgi:hypothetical protein
VSKKISILGFSLLLTCCFKNDPTFEKHILVGQLGMPIKLEHYKHLDGKAFQYADTATFVITDNQELKDAIDEIKNADKPEPWKGAGWDKIKIYYADTILNIKTDSKKIGLFANGQFYDLDNGNFITERMNDR